MPFTLSVQAWLIGCLPRVIVAGTGTSSPAARRAATSIARRAITSIIALR